MSYERVNSCLILGVYHVLRVFSDRDIACKIEFLLKSEEFRQSSYASEPFAYSNHTFNLSRLKKRANPASMLDSSLTVFQLFRIKRVFRSKSCLNIRFSTDNCGFKSI